MAVIDINKLYEIAGRNAPELAFELFNLTTYLRENFEAMNFFENSVIDAASRVEVFDKLFPKPSKAFKEAVHLLIRKDLMDELPRVADGLAAMVKEKDGVDLAEVKVAFAADPEFLGLLKKAFGKKIKARVEVDPGILGGFLLRFFDGRTFDASLRGRLSKLRSEILQ